MAYSKLHSSLVNSSLWTEPDHVRLLFITLLALCDKDGCVYGSRPGLERAAMLDPDECVEINPWEVLLGPDAHSSDKMRAPENEGRRIEEIPGGFRLLNFTYYRGLRNDDDRREQNRIAQEKFRKKSKPASAILSRGNPPKAHTEAEAEAEAEISQPQASISVASLPKHRVFSKPTLDEVKFACEKAGLPITEGARFWDYYESNGWRVGKNPMRSWQSALANWKRNFDTQRYANSQTARRSNPRNDGIAIGPTDYGEAAKRKLERQALEARNREASEAQAT